MKHLTGLLFMLLLAASCNKLEGDFVVSSMTSNPTSPQSRYDADGLRKALVVYQAGFNSLTDYLKTDVAELLTGEIPEQNGNLLFIYSHYTENGNYSIPTSPVLERIYKTYDGVTVRDTLKIYPEGTNSASAQEVHDVLTYLSENYHAGKWGMIMSSHASGWLPVGYYANPTSYKTYSKLFRKRQTPEPVDIPAEDPSQPLVRSWGQKIYNVFSNKGYEIDINDLADAIPFHLEYILFDSCLMGGIEVAYQFRDVCDKMVFSQTEILSEGFEYSGMAGHLLSNGQTDLESVCEDYYNHYQKKTGIDQSATVSLIDCTQLEPLAEACREIFTSHRAEIQSIEPSSVQHYYRYDRHWFYDLGDIISKSGASENEIAQFEDALDDCVLYKNATKYFMEEFEIKVHSGFSSYLPSNGSSYLNKYYKESDWNEATSLVE